MTAPGLGHTREEDKMLSADGIAPFSFEWGVLEISQLFPEAVREYCQGFISMVWESPMSVQSIYNEVVRF